MLGLNLRLRLRLGFGLELRFTLALGTFIIIKNAGVLNVKEDERLHILFCAYVLDVIFSAFIYSSVS